MGFLAMAPKTKAVRRIAICVLVGLMAAGLWQLRQGGATDPAAGDSSSGLTLYPGDNGVTLPSIQGRSVDGEALTLADYRGRVLVINVWGSWCAPCRAEAPDLVEVATQTEPRGVRFVGIDVRDNPSAAQAFARSFGMTYPSFDDKDGTVLGQLSGIVPVGAVPSTLVVDKAGIVRARVVGVVDAATLRGLVEDVEKIG